MIPLSRGERRGALRTDLRELDVATLAVAVGGTIVLADFARQVMYRVLVGYFCHNSDLRITNLRFTRRPSKSPLKGDFVRTF